MKTEFTGLRINPDLKDALERIAEREKRTLSQLIHIVLEEYVAKDKRRKRK